MTEKEMMKQMQNLLGIRKKPSEKVNSTRKNGQCRKAPK